MDSSHNNSTCSQQTTAPAGQSPSPNPNAAVCPRGAAALLSLAALAYAVLVVSHWSDAYVDFGDGNYLYISWRLSEGATLYKDLLAPQPPMHFLFGWLLAKFATLTHLPMLYVFRSFSVLLHLCMACLAAILACKVATLTGRDSRRGTIGALAGFVYLFLPIGFWWSLGYQSEPLEIVFLYGALLALLAGQRSRSAVAAGILAAAASLTNMTAAPYALFFLLYLVVRERQRALPYLVALILVWGGCTLILELKTGAYLENVIFNQVGSFPRKEFLPAGENVLTYAWRKILNEGRDVLALEGGFIILALVGLVHTVRAGRHSPRLELFVWSALALMASIVYVSKGGTMDYIFTIGEPAVAILTAIAVADLVSDNSSAQRLPWHKNTLPLAYLVTAVALIVVVWAPAIGFVARTLRQETFELDAYKTRQVVELMRQHTTEHDAVLAPPFYAFLAQRRIIADYSEIFLWTLKYYNEKQDKQRGRGVTSVEKIASALRARSIAFVALDLDQTGRIPEIKTAIDEHYRPLRQSEFRTLNTRLMFYVPR